MYPLKALQKWSSVEEKAHSPTFLTPSKPILFQGVMNNKVVGKLCSLYPILFGTRTHFVSSWKPLVITRANTSFFFSSSAIDVEEEEEAKSVESAKIFKMFGYNNDQISKIFIRRPALLNADPTKLKSKLALLLDLGFTTSDLVNIINCRPRFLSGRIDRPDLHQRMNFLQSLFGSKDMLHKAIIRNPSLLNYHLHHRIKRFIAIYLRMGIPIHDLVSLLISRPMLITRTSLNYEKIEFIRKIGVSSHSKMYKYVVSLIAISRLETIWEKVTNFEKFGFSCDDVMDLFGRSPMILTLSVDKVQRNMAFIIGVMKLPAALALDHPFLLYCNLESVLKPRFLLAEKVRVMNLSPEIIGPSMLRAMRMKESRFLKAFVNCHSEDITKLLMECYTKAKGIKRLAETSKRSLHKGFPF